MCSLLDSFEKNARSLARFLLAQEDSYAIALNEIKQGEKKSHWMWYIFPQIKGLGYSYTAQYYAIQTKQEAEEFLQHPILAARLYEITNELLKIDGKNASEIFGYPDDMKLKSSMTLFYLVSHNDIFLNVLEKFFSGELDINTVKIWEKI